MSTRSFYKSSDGAYHPQQPATGSWNKQHQNGVAVGGLLARLIDVAPEPRPMLTSRITIDILRAVPFGPLTATVETIRDGARQQVLTSRLFSDGVLVAQANALKVRIGSNPAAGLRMTEAPLPEEAGNIPVTRVLGAGHPMETRVVSGSGKDLGPGAYWTNFNAELVEGESISPLVRVVMAADIGSGVSSVLDSKTWSYANLDLSVYLARAPVDEWVLADCRTDTVGSGTGLVSTVLYDRNGEFGRAHQTLFINPRV